MSPSVRQALVVMSFILIAAVVAYPYLRESIREFPIVVILLLGALVVHAMARGRAR